LSNYTLIKMQEHASLGRFCELLVPYVIRLHKLQQGDLMVCADNRTLEKSPYPISPAPNRL
jgi:hypothetical protein